MPELLNSIEQRRIHTLTSLHILDTEPEPIFDGIVELARSLTGAQTGLIALVAADRQWFKARVGLNVSETPREIAFCAHAILDDAVFCVPDASSDHRFSANPLVTGEPHIRSYIGAPIIVREQRIGTVCAFDPKPRQFDEALRRQFQLLATMAAERIELRQRISFITGLAKATSDAVIATDEHQNITYWGGGAEEMFGFTAAEAAHLKLDALMPDRVKAAHNAGFARFRSTGRSELAGHTTEMPARHKNGTEFPVDLGVTIWRDGDSVMIGGILRDASDRRSLAEARVLNEAQSRFLANMSHEIRTPLNGVLGMAQVLERGQLEEGQRTLVRVIRDSAEGLNRLLSDILESARLEAGGTVVNRDAFDLGELIAKVAALHHGAAMAKGLRFTWTEVPANTWLVGDAVKIGQIIGNLLSNAIKFTQSGEVRLSAEQHANTWRFTVSDTGIGFSADQHQQIFLRFRQADESSTRRHGGSGLGLSISRQLAQAMDGDVSASSQPGVGSTFCLSLLLPAHAPISSAAKEAQAELIGVHHRSQGLSAQWRTRLLEQADERLAGGST